MIYGDKEHFDKIEERITRLERILFLVTEANREGILSSWNLDSQDKQLIAEYYDQMRGNGW